MGFPVNQLPLLADRSRIACVEIPSLPLQLVLRKHPSWQADPLVVVEDDRPQARILWTNRPARTLKIQRGMPFNQAKSLSAKLRAAVVPETEVASAVDELFDMLLDFSPFVEPVVEMPGLFWLDPTGLGGLFGNLSTWAQKLHKRLEQARYGAAVAVGFARPYLFCLGRMQLGPVVHERRDAEMDAAHRVPLQRLSLAPRLLEDMALLGIERVGEFLDLPSSSLKVRYGQEAANLHAFLSGKTWTPLQPKSPSEPTVITLEVDPPDDDHTRLLFGLKNLLHGVVDGLSKQSEAISALSLAFFLEGKLKRDERLESAAPTLDVVQWADLLRLRLSATTFPARVEHIEVTVEHRRVHPKQLAMQRQQQRRDLTAANRALARLRATFSSSAVTRAVLRDAHLPEGGYRYEPVSEVAIPEPHDVGHALPLVRRVFSPSPLPPLPTHEPEAWLGQHGAVKHMFGPYRIAGGWWAKRRERDYYFLETQPGDALWVFYDRPRRKWFLHGLVS